MEEDWGKKEEEEKKWKGKNKQRLYMLKDSSWCKKNNK